MEFVLLLLLAWDCMSYDWLCLVHLKSDSSKGNMYGAQFLQIYNMALNSNNNIMYIRNCTLDRNFPAIIGPIPWGHSSPLCHALSLSLSSLSLSWTSMRRRRATVLLATPGELA